MECSFAPLARCLLDTGRNDLNRPTKSRRRKPCSGPKGNGQSDGGYYIGTMWCVVTLHAQSTIRQTRAIYVNSVPIMQTVDTSMFISFLRSLFASYTPNESMFIPIQCVHNSLDARRVGLILLVLVSELIQAGHLRGYWVNLHKQSTMKGMSNTVGWLLVHPKLRGRLHIRVYPDSVRYLPNITTFILG